MKQISAVDLYFLTLEMKEVLINQRIETFYQEDDIFYLKVYVKGRGHFFLVNRISKYIFLDDKKLDKSTFPSSFIQYLRKFLKNGFIVGFEQFENERILKIEIDKKNSKTGEMDTFYLFIELFANGNIIITDKNWIIKNSIIKKKFKDRKVIVKEKFELPPQRDISIFNLDESLFRKLLLESDLDVVKFIAIKLGVGGKYSEEIVFNSKIDKNISVIDLTEEQINILISEIKKISIKPISAVALINSSGEIQDFYPFKFNSIKLKKNENFKEFDSFNNLLLDYFSKFRISLDQREEEFKKIVAKLENRIKKQEKIRNQILKDSVKFNEFGNKIYENYAFIDEFLKSVNKAGKEKGWDYVRKIISENEELNKKVVKFNPNKNEFILDL